MLPHTIRIGDRYTLTLLQRSPWGWLQSTYVLRDLERQVDVGEAAWMGGTPSSPEDAAAQLTPWALRQIGAWEAMA